MSKWFRDDVDRKLVAMLQANARESTSSIAKRLNVARSTINERINRLEKSGVITGYSVVLSKNPSEGNVQALVMIAVDQKKGRKVVEELNKFPAVKVCLAINGDFDYFMSIELPTLEELDAMLDEIAEMDGVSRSTSSIVLSRKFDRRYKEVLSMVQAQMGSAEQGE
ncbi:Lrp/AsnC family transcriptional regulator [Halomonas sp. HNIBRBA4712]|uniref:Lrp/AsnC family transcriptional regulator n=1 Tax=Halomonas sp. HNIBRBA4712 TaxID=3373087 RepID=UPI003747208E